MKHIQTRLAHAAFSVDQETGAVIPPIHVATTYERAPDNSYPSGYSYSREGNPTRNVLESTLADLEGGAACRAFSSGLAASHAVLMALPPASHIVIPDDVYYGFRKLVRSAETSTGLSSTEVDMSDLDSVSRAMRPETALVWVETPSNPLLKISDIRGVAAIATEGGAALAVDGTWGTPVLQRPLELGAHIVVHSLTKYLAGHSDVLGGAVISRTEDALFDRIAEIQALAGAVLDPFSSWLTVRGLRTLAVRIQAQCQSAARIADWLQRHNRVRKVYYPGLASHPGHGIAASQMSSPGGMLSFEVEGGAQGAVAVAAAVEIITRATSLGGTESLIEHRASVEGPDSPTPPGLLRLSIGLEYVDDLIGDLDRALAEI